MILLASWKNVCIERVQPASTKNPSLGDANGSAAIQPAVFKPWEF
jgi:hypothetical protein